jgi:hypothetical protein
MDKAEPLLDSMNGQSSGGAIASFVYHLSRGEIDRALEAGLQATAQRFPAFIPVWCRAFEPRLRQSPAWPNVLTAMNLRPASEFRI